MAGMTPNNGSVFGGGSSNAAFKKQLNKVYGWYTVGFILFVVVLGIHMGPVGVVIPASRHGHTCAWFLRHMRLGRG